MHLFKADLLDEFERLLKIFTGLAGEADHHVGGYRRVLEGRSQLAAKVIVFGAVVVPVHALERLVAAALKRNMKLRAEFFDLGKPRNDFIRDMVRLKRTEPHSANALGRSGRTHRVDDIAAALGAVGGEIDADKHYLAEAVLSKRSDLAPQLIERL